MLRPIVILLICTIGVLLSNRSLAQTNKKGGIHDYIPSENVDSKKKFRKKQNAPKEKKISLIVKNKTTGLLYGNACMTENTHRMGFEYSIQIEGLPGSLTDWERMTDNMWVHLRLIFTKGPWWKMVLKKRVKDCRQRSGDLVG